MKLTKNEFIELFDNNFFNNKELEITTGDYKFSHYHAGTGVICANNELKKVKRIDFKDFNTCHEFCEALYLFYMS